MSKEKLTPEQIENWRNVLYAIIGPYALMMSAAQIQSYRDKLQGGLTISIHAPNEGSDPSREERNK